MADSCYLASIASEELTSLIDQIHQKTALTKEVLEQYGTSGFHLSLLAFRDDLSETDLEEMKVAWENFQQLCQSTPDTDPDCLLHFSIAYANLLLAMNEDGTLNGEDRVRSLIFATESKILALLTPVTAAVNDHFSEKATSLSKAGKLGAERKHAGYQAIKQWALREAKQMKGSHRQIAKTLEMEIPAHLTRISDDPRRFIYDVLRADSAK